MVVTLGQQLVVADVIHTFSAYCIPHSGVKMSKRLDEIISCKKIKTSSWHLIGFPDGSNAGSTVVAAAVVDSHTFSVLSLQLKKLRWHDQSAIDLTNDNPTRGYKEVRRSTGHIMVVTACYSNQQGSKSR